MAQTKPSKTRMRLKLQSTKVAYILRFRVFVFTSLANQLDFIVQMSWLLSVVEAQTRKCPHFQRKVGVHPRPGGRPRGGNIEHSVLQTDALTAPMRQSATVCDSQLHCRALCRIALRRVRVLRIESPVQGGPPNDADQNNDTCVAAPVAGGTLNTESSSRQCPAGASGASAQDRESCPGGTPQRSRQK